MKTDFKDHEQFARYMIDKFYGTKIGTQKGKVFIGNKVAEYTMDTTQGRFSLGTVTSNKTKL